MLAAVRRALADAEDFEIVDEVSVGSRVLPAVRETKPDVVLLDMRMPELDGSRVLPAVRETKPDVVLLDMRMPELDGLACLGRLRKHDPTIAVVILSSYSDEDQIDAAREAGALGYIVKTIEPVDLPSVLRSALAGHPFAVWGQEAQPSVTSTGAVALSERETAVLEAVARGLSNKEIGRELWISEQTVKFHLRNLYRKLGVTSRTEAARYAYSSGVAVALAADSS